MKNYILYALLAAAFFIPFFTAKARNNNAAVAPGSNGAGSNGGNNGSSSGTSTSSSVLRVSANDIPSGNSGTMTERGVKRGSVLLYRKGNPNGHIYLPFTRECFGYTEANPYKLDGHEYIYVGYSLINKQLMCALRMVK